MANTRQNTEFGSSILTTDPLDEAIDWINSNMDPDEVFEQAKLEVWAEANGFVRDLND